MTASRSGVRMLVWGTLLGGLLVLGFAGEVVTRVAYAVEKGRIQAATDELAQLDAQLASIQTVSKAFNLVAQMSAPGVVQLKLGAEEGDDEYFERAVRRFLRDHSDRLNPQEQDIIARWLQSGDASLLRELTDQPNPDDNMKWRRLRSLQPGTGSGIIFDSRGYILTNNHVVQSRSDITVLLSDDREVQGKLVGLDPKTDLAVVKIEGDSLHALPFGDSDQVKVGDWVLAIGAPFGLTQTVTHGIVSAVGRARIANIDIDYQNFIQTDAAVNPGNSGGPLLDLRGKVIGLNTAIATENTGVNAGVAFVIPSRTARRVAEQLRDMGEVARGWVGIGIRDLDSLNARLLNVPHTRGALVTGVYRDSPGGKAGLQPDDVVIRIDGQAIRDGEQFRSYVAEQSPGQTLQLEVIRDEQPQTLRVQLDKQPPDTRAYQLRNESSLVMARELPHLGISVLTSRPMNAGPFHDADLKGLYVVEHGDLPLTSAYRLLTQIDGRPVNNFRDVQEALGAARPGEPIELRFSNPTGDELSIRHTLNK